MEDFYKCIESLSSAKNDTEKSAYIFAFVKTLKLIGGDLDIVQQKYFFDAIGTPFFVRLLNAQKISEGSPEESVRSDALAVLATLSVSHKSPAHNFSCSNLDTFKEILQSKKEPISTHDLTHRDILQCLINVCSTEEGRNCIFSKHFVNCLTDMAIRSSLEHEKALHLLMILSHYFKSDLWDQDSSSFSTIIDFIAREFREETTSHKFELCDTLAKLLTDNSKCSADPHGGWSQTIREGLCDLLRKKLERVHSNSAFKLACAMVERFGLLWILNNRDEAETVREDLCLLIHLVVQMILENRTVEKIVESIDMLSTCYTILEATITVLRDESIWCIGSATTEQLLLAINGAFRAVVSFVLKASKEWDEWHNSSETSEHKCYLTLVSVRVLSFWLAEETLALKEEMCKVISCLLKIGKHVFLGKKDQFLELMDQTICDQSVDVICFLSPSLYHMSADDTTRRILMDQDAPKLLFEYLDFQWLLWKKSMNRDSETCIITLCGKFMNIVVLEAKIVTESLLFFSLLKFLLNAIPHIPRDFEHISLKANITVLGLLIARQHTHKIKSCETSFYHFFSASVKFLWDAHQVENSHDTPSLVIVREYRKVWSDIMELWFLGMQALSSLLPTIHWVATFLLESGWPQYIVSSLVKVNSHAVEASTKSTYQEFLCCLLRNCPDAKEQLLNSGAMLISEIHGLKELEALLK